MATKSENIITWLRDDVSWAITIVGIILIVYTVGSFLSKGVCDFQVVSTGITGIVALARGNGKDKSSGKVENQTDTVKTGDSK
jgi:hypothetical protein